MGAQHTPGPWSVSKGSAYYICCDGSWIASAMGIRGPEGEANARLIAAAPELLTALGAARAQIIACHLTAGLTLDSAIRNIDPKIDAAIAKARGEVA